MNADLSSINAQSCEFKLKLNYAKKAVGDLLEKKGYWSDHPCNKILGRKISISPSIIATKIDQTLAISIGGPFFTSLDVNAMLATPKSVGPYIDCVGISIKPKSNKNAPNVNQECHFMADSQGGTAIKSIQKFTSSTPESLSASLSSLLAELSKLMANLNVNSSTSQKQEVVVEHEFSPEKYGQDKEVGVRARMNKCWTDAKVTKDYDPGQISSLHLSRHSERVKMALIPIWGWFGGFQIIPDELCIPPRCAQTSISVSWDINYHIPHLDSVGKIQDIVSLKLKLEARSVFATIESKGGYKPSGTGNFVNFIATTHQIKLLLVANIPENTLEIRPTSMKVLCEGGVDDQIIERSLTQTLKNNQPVNISFKEEAITEKIEKFLVSTKQLSQPKPETSTLETKQTPPATPSGH